MLRGNFDNESCSSAVINLFLYIWRKTILRLSLTLSGRLIGLYSEEFFNIPTRVADSSIVNCCGVLLKNILAADLIPSA